MAPKQAVSKKAKEKKKNQAIEDATFGLKNKNKSAKVQKYVSQVNATMKNNLSDAVSEAFDGACLHYLIPCTISFLSSFFLINRNREGENTTKRYKSSIDSRVLLLSNLNYHRLCYMVYYG